MPVCETSRFLPEGGVIKRITIIGMGQIGTSLARGLRRAGFVRIVGIDRPVPPSRLRRLDKDDLVILAVPVRSILAYLKILPRGPLIMDVGSTKRNIVGIARARGLKFIGAHPVAGTERSGPAAGKAGLFQGRRCFLTMIPGVSPADRRFVATLWKRLGAETSLIDPIRHDRLFARISHLPHAVSFSFVRAILPALKGERVRRWAAGSFRDMTRLAASPEDVWADIFLENRKELLPLLRRLCHELRQLHSLLSAGHPKSLNSWISQARRLQEKIQ